MEHGKTRLRQNTLDAQEFHIFATESEQDGTQLTEQDIQNLRDAYSAVPDESLLVLIGKDGGVKRRSDEIVGMTKLFNQIDAMPMRQREMNRP